MTHSHEREVNSFHPERNSENIDFLCKISGGLLLIDNKQTALTA